MLILVNVVGIVVVKIGARIWNSQRLFCVGHGCAPVPEWERGRVGQFGYMRSQSEACATQADVHTSHHCRDAPVGRLVKIVRIGDVVGGDMEFESRVLEVLPVGSTSHFFTEAGNVMPRAPAGTRVTCGGDEFTAEFTVSTASAGEITVERPVWLKLLREAPYRDQIGFQVVVDSGPFAGSTGWTDAIDYGCGLSEDAHWFAFR